MATSNLSNVSDRSLWLVGQRVSRQSSDKLGFVVKQNGKIKVKWDGGGTSYFTLRNAADVKKSPIVNSEP